MWKGRFQQQTAALLQTYSESISYDWRLWPHDIEGSVAHSAALEKAGLLTPQEREAIVKGLQAIGADIETGAFQFRMELEDIHMNIESELTRRIGDPGAKLHTARSRNDQVALDIRLYLRSEVDVLDGLLRELQSALVDLGSAMPKLSSPVIPTCRERSLSTLHTICLLTWKCCSAIETVLPTAASALT